MTDLISEINAAGDAGEALTLLRSAGVSDRVLLTPEGICGAFGFDRIAPTKTGLYESSEDGADAIVIGARDTYGDLTDLVAWPVADPTKFYRRIGAAVFLGEGAIEFAAFTRRALRVFANPLSWLQAGCSGGVILDRSADLRPVLDGIPVILSETAILGNQIARQLRERTHYRLPKIKIPKFERAAA